MTNAEQVSGACAERGEGPFWDAAGDQLLFVDLERGAALAMTDSGTVDRHEFGGVTAAIQARRQGATCWPRGAGSGCWAGYPSPVPPGRSL